MPAAPRFRSLTLAADGKVTTSSLPTIPRAGVIRIDGGRVMKGETALTEPFAAIDSFDVSESRGEVVFSAKRDGGFDIGLVSTDGSPVSWAPNETLDEVGVQWAPRGNKVSYIVRVPGGDVVRTLHIPTSYQLSVDFPFGTVHALAWDPAADRFAVSWSSPDASDRVEVMKYGGEERRVAVKPAMTLDVEVEPLAPGAIVLRPRDLAYDERVPLVVWRAENFDWNDARAALIREARVAVAITTGNPGEDFWRAARERVWLDANRVYAVGTALPQGISIVADASVPTGRYRETGSVVAVPPAVVQSFAARFIADQLKRTTPPNGSSR